jgi:serine/threonine protein kinase
MDGTNDKSTGKRATVGAKGEAAPAVPPREEGEAVSEGERTTLKPAWKAAEERKGKRWAAGEEILGRYVVEGELGQGGMGVVYGCFDTVGGVKVAVKALPPEVSRDRAEMEGVKENFRLVGGLRHPNIVGVKTLEEDAGGECYLVMDMAEGESLRRWMHREPGRGEPGGGAGGADCRWKRLCPFCGRWRRRWITRTGSG